MCGDMFGYDLGYVLDTLLARFWICFGYVLDTLLARFWIWAWIPACISLAIWKTTVLDIGFDGFGVNARVMRPASCRHRRVRART